MEQMLPVRRVIIVSKAHVDVGFTESADKVLHDNINWEFGVVMDQARQLRERGGAERFVWTVPSWIIITALERMKGKALARLEQALSDGDLAWHGLPFTTHSELMDPELFSFGLSLSQTLDQRFGKQTIAAKMSDVPGHTRGIIPLLAQAGIRMLHIGVNHMSATPQVPPAFRWRDPQSNSEIVTIYSNSYAADLQLPQSDSYLAFRMIGDNMEIPSIADILSWYDELRKQFPDADIAYGTLSDFARTITEEQIAALPVFEQEIGDTWIHGVGSDPAKVARFCALSRLRRRWLESQQILPGTRAYFDFSSNLLVMAEHTWGISLGAWLHDITNQRNIDFTRVRHLAPFRYCEASWQEQRDYIEHAVDGLRGTDLHTCALRELAELTPVMPDLRDWNICPSSPLLSFDTQRWHVTIDGSGAISLLSDLSTGHNLLAPYGRIGLLQYQTFSSDDCDRYARQYCGEEASTGAEAGFGRPGLRPEHAESRHWPAQLLTAWTRTTPTGLEVLCAVTFDSRAHIEYGAPAQAFLHYVFPIDSTSVAITLQWFDKTATRLPEACWLSFQPNAPRPEGWTMSKMGRWISPLEVVSRGGRKLHATSGVVRYHDGINLLHIHSLDAPLVAPGTPTLMNFDDQLPDLAGGMHFNLHNNQWTTNFPLWYEDDAIFRFNVEFESQ